MELVVYYDEDYPTVWVQREISKKITNFLKSKKFVVYNAEDLASWMEKSIQDDMCWQGVVVFSQDIVPDTICHGPFPYSLIREYLDCGGSIVWIGDIPFFYYGLLDPSNDRTIALKPHEANVSSPALVKTQRGELETLYTPFKSAYLKDQDGKFAKYWSSGGCFSILGVMPVYQEFTHSKVSITGAGKSFGLQTAWYSIRPILIKGSNLGKDKVTVLATTKPLSLISTRKTIFRARVRSLREMEVEERAISFPRIIDAISKSLGPIVAVGLALGSIAAGIREFAAVPSLVWFAIAAGFLLLAFLLWFFHWREIIASAWVKNFNQQHPTSGFVRLWDFKLHRITDSMLEELYKVALSRIETNVASKSNIGVLAECTDK